MITHQVNKVFDELSRISFEEFSLEIFNGESIVSHCEELELCDGSHSQEPKIYWFERFFKIKKNPQRGILRHKACWKRKDMLKDLTML